MTVYSWHKKHKKKRNDFILCLGMTHYYTWKLDHTETTVVLEIKSIKNEIQVSVDGYNVLIIIIRGSYHHPRKLRPSEEAGQQLQLVSASPPWNGAIWVTRFVNKTFKVKSNWSWYALSISTWIGSDHSVCEDGSRNESPASQEYQEPWASRYAKHNSQY